MLVLWTKEASALEGLTESFVWNVKACQSLKYFSRLGNINISDKRERKKLSCLDFLTINPI